MLFELWSDILSEALIDTLKLLPVLFLAYLLIEYLEHSSGNRLVRLLLGRYGAFTGALFGAVPQCGFSVGAANLYAAGAVPLGTLIAVFISTSDEAIPILVGYPALIPSLLFIVLFKICYGAAAGALINLFSRKRTLPPPKEVENPHKVRGNLWICTIKHTLSVALYLFIVSVLLLFVLEYAGEDFIVGILGGGGILQVLAASLVGLIPSCAASVVLTRLYVEGALGIGALTAGLCSGAGVGMLVLLRFAKKKDNVKLIALLFALSVAAGLLINLFIRT